MILPELLGQQSSPIGYAFCAPWGKMVEMLVERGLEMANLTAMVSDLAKI